MKFEVTIEMRITKSYIVEADDATVAVEKAQEYFSIADDGTAATHEMELLGVCGVDE